MIEEIYKNIVDFYTVPLYLVTWFIAVIRYRRYFDTSLKYFPIYIMYTFLTELLGYLIKYHEEFRFFSDDKYSWHNVIIYNIYSVITFLFFYYIYWQMVKTKKYRQWIKYGTLVSMSSYVISLFFQDPFHMNLFYADLVASMVLLITIVLYFKERKNEKESYPIKYNLMFWISLGLGVFHIFFPFIFLIAYEAPSFYMEYNLHQVLLVLIVLMYGTFILGFILGKRKDFR